MNRIFTTLFVILLLPIVAFAQTESKNVKIEILSQKESVKAGDTFYVALKQTLAPEWHTYWRNPGDVGDMTRIEWDAPNGIEFGPIVWARPLKLPYAEFINYGYENEVILPIEVKVSPNLKGPQNIKANVSWLECKDVCVPGEGVIEFTINVGDDKNSNQKSVIDNALNDAPKPMPNYTANWVKTDGKFHLGIISSEKYKIKNAYFFPYEIENGALIDHAKPQTLSVGAGGFGLYIEPSQSLPDNLPPKIQGLIELDTDKGQKIFEITANLGQTIAPQTIGGGASSAIDLNKLLIVIGGAIIGGIILNFMPCVFPVLAMKILGLTKIAHGHKNEARQYGIFYAIGVLITFSILGGLLFLLKSIGAATGWGFQLQDPSFLIFMIGVLTLLGLNLLGLFEIGVGLQSIGANFASKSGREGAFFSGVLAVLVASPCTAPFMGGALGYAITQTPIIGLLVFLGLGFGMALPFLILTFFPALLSKLPKPGVWMDKLKKILAIPMFLTAAWLLWVLSAVSSFVSIAIAALILTIGIWLFVKKTNFFSKPVFQIAILAISFLGAMSVSRLNLDANALNASKQTGTQANAIENKWSEERVTAELANGKKVFVNFTADWCITCKVNEAAVFKKADIIQEMEKQNFTYLVADWTKKDDKIARALSSHGRVGVPLYLIYDGKGDEPRILPQILTPAIILDELRK